MPSILVDQEAKNALGFLYKDFNKAKFSITYNVVNNPLLKELQNLAREQCLGKKHWPKIDKVNAWMMTAETATFMKVGGLGMIASELPEAFNQAYCADGKGECIKVVTPLYLGEKGKKTAFLKDGVYFGAEGKSLKVVKYKSISVPFLDKEYNLVLNKTDIYVGEFNGVEYIFLANDRFFSINPHKENKTAQIGAYVLNENGVDEVERFAFFSKAVYTLLKEIEEGKIKDVQVPNVLVANDWHSGAVSGLMKYLTTAQEYVGEMDEALALRLKNIPIVHIAHHLGYQGWDYDNTSKILNSLYENVAYLVFRNAKPIKNTNPRSENTLIVYDCYNQASTNFHLADRVVTVSKNYMDEVSRHLKLGLDFRDILKIRRDHRNFFGIVNGYAKSLISPNENKIEAVNEYFGVTSFKTYCSKSLENKLHNKQEFVKLISKLAVDGEYKKKVLSQVELYKFADILKLEKDIDKVPIISATSRMVEQKGYDIAAEAMMKLMQDAPKSGHFPIAVLGGAGNDEIFGMLKKLKDDVTKMNPKIGERIFVFHGYRDEFAYAIQLASDFYLMPSRFEPCGLTQMEAMAKGAIPIVTSTGGLVDTIEDGVDGFKTEVFFVDKTRVYGSNIAAQRLKTNANAFAETLEKALGVFYSDKKKMKEMQVAAMNNDFSWEGGSLQKYYSLFHTGHL